MGKLKVTGYPQVTDVHMNSIENKDSQEAICEQELAAIRDSLELLGGKWKLRIVRYLFSKKSGKNTFKKIQREIAGISAKMLSRELYDLEINLLVTRTVLDTRPVSVEYEITDHGRSVIPVADTLVAWGLNHRDKIKN